jgi:hypothetical protein
MSQVTISPPAPRGGRKIRGLNDTGTKMMWFEKFKSPIVTRTNRVGRIVTTTKRGWTKLQGTVFSVSLALGLISGCHIFLVRPRGRLPADLGSASLPRQVLHLLVILLKFLPCR